MMNEMNMPLTYWAEAFHTAVHIMNQTPIAAVHEISPYERLYGIKPTVSYMRVFGCVCHVHVPNEARKKMEPKAVKCIFLGYPVEKKGYKCYDPTTRQVYVSRDVRFCEHEPWYKPKPVTIEYEYEEQENVCHVFDEPRPSTRTILGPHMVEESTKSVNPWSGRLRDKKQDEKGKKKMFEEMPEFKGKKGNNPKVHIQIQNEYSSRLQTRYSLVRFSKANSLANEDPSVKSASIKSPQNQGKPSLIPLLSIAVNSSASLQKKPRQLLHLPFLHRSNKRAVQQMRE
ncbi:hypothetical protein L7F22_045128 [Adiantum nelumboides]|nr:hypothetical protein [Adiantum nelumboides]